jgi:hypothetical protein
LNAIEKADRNASREFFFGLFFEHTESAKIAKETSTAETISLNVAL